MDKKCAQVWERLSAALKPQISPDSFKRWFSAVELVQATDKSLTFRVPNNIYQFWIESNYMTALQSAVITSLGAPRAVRFSSPSGSAGQTPLEDAVTLKEILPELQGDTKTGASLLGLNPRNTFESFVVGPNNEIAHAASLAVAQSPARTETVAGHPVTLHEGILRTPQGALMVWAFKWVGGHYTGSDYVGKLRQLILAQGAQVGRELHGVEQRRFGTVTHRSKALSGAVPDVIHLAGPTSVKRTISANAHGLLTKTSRLRNRRRCRAPRSPAAAR